MKLFTTLALFLSLLVVSPAFAGSGHYHGPKSSQVKVTAEEATKRAMKMIEDLAAAKKIDASWIGIKESLVEQKMFNDSKEWVIVFKNSKIEDFSKQTLYLYLSLAGEYIAANHTGN